MRSGDALRIHDELPEHEAVRLMMVATGRTRTDVVLGFDLTDDEARRYESFVGRRIADEPLQYIEGTVEFGQVELVVDPRVLVPRPETEYMLEQAMALVEEPSVIVDLCTGSGNLALSLARAYPRATVYAVDLSQDAADLATRNAEHNGLEIEVFVGDLFDPLPKAIRGDVDLLIANPPYLAASEVADLPQDVLREPRGALVAGPVGDEIVERIGVEASSWLSQEGTVACEVSEFHARTVIDNFRDIEATVVQDLTGRDRFVVGVRSVG